jgi:probable phosphoglycerate mutase
MTRIVLVRHGQTAWNREDRFRGRVNAPLDATGCAQAEAAAHRIASLWRPVAVYSSPLSRAAKTAEAIARPFGLEVQFHPGLVDLDFGEWQGLTAGEVAQRWPDLITAWHAAPDGVCIPGGETLDLLRSRSLACLVELSDRHKGDTIVLVAHDAVNRAMVLGALGMGNDRFWQLRHETAAISVLDGERRQFTLISLNDTCHLRPPSPESGEPRR